MTTPAASAPLFADFDLEAAIEAAARERGVALDGVALEVLARHARAVAVDEPHLHLSSIRDPREFVARHLGESFDGAVVLGQAATGTLVDLGSGNGYPGVPIVLTCPHLRGLLVDASTRRAEFLREAVSGIERLEVRCAQVQRPPDLPDLETVRAVTMRAVGGWQKIAPRLAPWLGDEGELLLWAGAEVEAVARRVAWQRFVLIDRRPLGGRDRAWIWRFRRARGSANSP